MAKRSTERRLQAEEVKRQTKKQVAIGKREARQNRIIYLAIAAVAAIILIVALVGIIMEVIIAPSQPVAVVNGAKIPADKYQDLVTYNRYFQYITMSNMQGTLDQFNQSPEENEFLISFYEQQLGQVQQQLSLLPQTTLDQLIDYELLAQKAEEEGISVTDAEVEEAIRADLRQALTPAATEPVTGTEPTPTPVVVTEDDVDEFYSNILDTMGLSAREYETIVHRDLLLDKLQEFLAGQVETTGLVAHPQIIKVETQQEAEAALARIEGGEEFAIVAQEVSTDTLTASAGGDVGTVTPEQVSGRYGEAVQTAVFGLPIGDLEIVESDGMFYIVQVLERDENGDLPADVVTQLQDQALGDWLEAAKADPSVEIERTLDPEQIPPDPFAALFNQ
ncbi:MAG: SurA N-terminal domain-containing protein [Anaerolineae bacterium]|nr:SurA N-terminal domain-containing protein [Anaerolineae bacterium]